MTNINCIFCYIIGKITYIKYNNNSMVGKVAKLFNVIILY